MLHLPFSIVGTSLLYHLLPFSNKTVNDFCNSWCLVKAHRLPSHSSTHITTSPFELVYTDLWGPAPMASSTGYYYYIAFVDSHTRYTWLYLLRKKSDALPAFQIFQKMVETQFSSKIKALQSDWGGEYRSFTSLMQQLGIHHRHICPHTHHQNGMVERKHRHIVETGGNPHGSCLSSL